MKWVRGACKAACRSKIYKTQLQKPPQTEKPQYLFQEMGLFLLNFLLYPTLDTAVYRCLSVWAAYFFSKYVSKDEVTSPVL